MGKFIIGIWVCDRERVDCDFFVKWFWEWIGKFIIGIVEEYEEEKKRGIEYLEYWNRN